MIRVVVKALMLAMMGNWHVMTMERGITPQQIEEIKSAIIIALRREEMKEELRKTPKGSQKYQDLTDELRASDRDNFSHNKFAKL